MNKRTLHPIDPNALLPIDTSLRAIPWMATPKVRVLEKFGIATVEALLTHLPHRYEDRRQFDRFPRDESGEAVCVCGRVEKISSRWLGGGRRMMEATLVEEEAHALSGRLTLRWFNAHYVAKRLAAGMKLVVYGKPKRSGSKIVLDHPEFEELEDEGGTLVSPNIDRITPVHPATAGVSPRELRGWVWRLLDEVDPQMEHPLPEALVRMPYHRALRQIHFPESQEALEEARRELTLAEFFRIQLFLATRRAEYATRPGHVHRSEGKLLKAFYEQLPFPLTGAQSRAVAEIKLDLASPAPMNRMLHGDVGSGKTVVALSAMLLAVEAGSPAAIMAPTQILAEQHYLNFKRWLEPLGIRVALRTGSRHEESGGGMPLFHGGGEGADSKPQIVVGTHALLYGEEFPQFGLAVIDEQHKFGVMQRSKLLRGERAPDLLVMTATPIPRTLTMTLYGDLEVSTLDELPAGRGKIITAARNADKLPDAVAFIRKQLDAGRQAYVVYPLVEESARTEAKAATAEYERWKTQFAPYRCELLHGRIPPEEKDAIMERFRSNESQVLVATTVIEVGVDVPNANIMLIENAERFGLAQLHQLRGRIGRGKHKSYCVLIHAADTPEGEEKMQTMEATANGFEIAEADLRLRGPGDLMGTAQSGLPPILIGDLLRDVELMRLARKTARQLLQADPDLSAPEHARFHLWVTRQAQRMATLES